jgi:hypothetical protein
MQTNLSSIISFCAQRKQQQLFNIPLSRIEIVSPYENSNVTKFQLDMRRKAEVLLYNQGNTKTNPLTKNQKWAQVVNGKSPPVSKSFLNQKKESDSYQVLNNWNNKINIPTPSSSCNVPNDYMNNVNYLFYDPSVVLYNYINPISTRSYGIINEALDTSVIRYVNYTDINTDISSNYISTVIFTDVADNVYYNLSLNNIPLAFQINGEISKNTNGSAYINIFQNYSYTLNIYYNDELVTSVNPSFNLYPSNDYFEIKNISNNSTTFSGTFLIGYLDITNIRIYGTPGYVYNFQLIINFNSNSESKDKNGTYHLTNINESIIANVSTTSKKNCDISFENITPTINTLGSFTISVV